MATGSEEPAALTVNLRVRHLLPCIVVLGVTFWWWRRRAAARPSSAAGHDNGCNNPNCLRCHSSSRRHVEAFRANATMLRRLVKLEPVLFEDISQGLWGAIEEMERKFERDEHLRSGHLNRARERIWKFWKSLPTIHPNEARVLGGDTLSATPLSPQPGQDPTVFMLPGLEAVPMHDADHCQDACPCVRLWKSLPRPRDKSPIPVTGDIEALRQGYETIRTELLSYLSGEQSTRDPFQPFDPNVYTQANTTTGQGSNLQHTSQHPEWSSIYLYREGIRQSETCKKYFPQTTNILETKCPNLIGGKCGFGAVYFSKLRPNTRVKEHCGPTNVRWRCHLPLVVPKNVRGEERSCLRVGLPGVSEQRVGWEEGVPILFDDSFLHSAVQCSCKSGEARIVLIVDFWHPTLSESDRTALGILYPPGQ